MARPFVPLVVGIAVLSLHYRKTPRVKNQSNVVVCFWWLAEVVHLPIAFEASRFLSAFRKGSENMGRLQLGKQPIYRISEEAINPSR
jgi:hypothetical protein